MTTHSTLKKYQASFLLIASVILHVFAIFFVLIFPKLWLWAVVAVICDHLIVVASGLLPRCQLLGSNWTQLPPSAINRGEIALTIDDGPHPEVTPQVLDILDYYGVKATFFCIGEYAETYPELCRDIVLRGHAVENHTQHHWHYFSLLLNRVQIYTEIKTAQHSLSAITGIKPLFFRPTAGLRNFLLNSVLFDLDLQLVSWTRRGFDTRETEPTRILAKLVKNLNAGDILLLHDGNAARTATGVPMIIQVLPQLLETIKTANLHPVTLKSALL